jgi:hypothetical protein
MAKHKVNLKQIAEHLGIPEGELSEIDIEDVGTLPGVAERYKLADQHAQLSADLNTRTQQLQAVAQYFQQLQAQQQQRYAQAGYQAPEWYEDPILAPVGKTVQALQQGHQEAQQRYSQALYTLANHVDGMYAEGARLMNKFQKYMVKAQNPDFDEDKVTKWAKETGYRGDWEESHRAWKAANLESIVSEKIKSAREEAMREAEGKLNAPITEMGGDGGTPADAGGKPRSWDDAWSGFGKELGSLGFGSH